MIELALSPKSNSAISAIDEALSDVRNNPFSPVPNNLKDAHYKGAKKLNHGNNYIYPHDFPNDWVAQQYLPDQLMNANYFKPKGNSKIERGFKTNYTNLKKLQRDNLNGRN